MPQRCDHLRRARRSRPAGGVRPAARTATASSAATPAPIVAAGGGLMVADAELTADWIAGPLRRDRSPIRRGSAAMAAAAASLGRARRRPAFGRDGRRRGRPEHGGVSVSSGAVRPAAELGRVHFVGIGGAGMSGIARIMLARGIAVSGSDAKDSSALTSLHALGARVAVGHTPGEPHRRRHGRGLLGDPADEPGGGGGPSARPRRTSPRGRTGERHGRAARRRGRRHARQDDDDLDADRRLQHCGADPSFAIGGSLNESGANAHDGSGSGVRRRGRRERRLVPPARSGGGDRDQRRGRPPRPLPLAGGGRAGLRVVRRRLQPGGFLVACLDDPGSRKLAGGRRGERRRCPLVRDVDRRDGAGRPPGQPRRAGQLRGGRPRAAARTGAAAAARPAQRTQRRRRVHRRVRARVRSAGPARRAGRVRRHPPAVRAQGHRARGPGLRRLRAPPDRAACRARGGARDRVTGAGHRLFPAPPLQPYEGVRHGVRRRARAGRRGRGDGRVRRPRGPGPRRHRRPRRGGRTVAARPRSPTSPPGRQCRTSWPSGPGQAMW